MTSQFINNSRQKSKMSLMGAKIKVSAGLCSFQRLQGTIYFLVFPPSRGFVHSLAHGPFLHLQSASLQPLPPSSHLLFLTFPFLL